MRHVLVDVVVAAALVLALYVAFCWLSNRCAGEGGSSTVLHKAAVSVVGPVTGGRAGPKLAPRFPRTFDG